MKRLMLLMGLCVVLGLGPSTAGANITFTFTEVGGTVVMTPSGTLDTTKMGRSGTEIGFGNDLSFWQTVDAHPFGGTDFDWMAGIFAGHGDLTAFNFTPGTDASAITDPNGPFAFYFGQCLEGRPPTCQFTQGGSRSFATLGFQQGGEDSCLESP